MGPGLDDLGQRSDDPIDNSAAEAGEDGVPEYDQRGEPFAGLGLQAGLAKRPAGQRVGKIVHLSSAAG